MATLQTICGVFDFVHPRWSPSRTSTARGSGSTTNVGWSTTTMMRTATPTRGSAAPATHSDIRPSITGKLNLVYGALLTRKEKLKFWSNKYLRQYLRVPAADYLEGGDFSDSEILDLVTTKNRIIGRGAFVWGRMDPYVFFWLDLDPI